MHADPILLDSRTGSQQLEPEILVLPGAPPCRLTTLTFGDAAFTGHGESGPVYIGIERKTLTDLLSSMKSGRLASHQLPGMTKLYDTSYLVVEGRIGWDDASGLLVEWRGGSWHPIELGSRRFLWEDLESYLTSLESFARVRLRKTRSLAQTARQIVQLYSWWQKPWASHSTFKVFHDLQSSAGFEKPTLIRRMASELPLIGWHRSAYIEQRFATPLDMVLADKPDWLIPGVIGPTIADRVYRSLRERESEIVPCPSNTSTSLPNP